MVSEGWEGEERSYRLITEPLCEIFRSWLQVEDLYVMLIGTLSPDRDPKP